MVVRTREIDAWHQGFQSLLNTWQAPVTFPKRKGKEIPGNDHFCVIQTSKVQDHSFVDLNDVRPSVFFRCCEVQVGKKQVGKKHRDLSRILVGGWNINTCPKMLDKCVKHLKEEQPTSWASKKNYLNIQHLGTRGCGRLCILKISAVPRHQKLKLQNHVKRIVSENKLMTFPLYWLIHTRWGPTTYPPWN